MINSIPKIESDKPNPFGKVTQKNLSSDYWVGGKAGDVDKVVISSSATPLNAKIILTPEEARKTHNTTIIGLSIAGATLLTAGTIFLLLKGGPKSIGKNFNKLRGWLDKKVQTAKLNGDGVLSTTGKIYVAALNTLNKLSEKSGFINNYTTIKDLTFKRIMGCNKYLAKAHDKITRMFEKLGRQSVINSYNKTNNKINNAIRYAADRVDLVTPPSKKAMIDDAKRINAEIESLAHKHFGSRALRSRYYIFKKIVENMKDAFSKMKVFLSKDVYSKFMADSQIIKQREEVSRSVIAARRELSYPVKLLIKDSDESIMKLVESLSFKDTDRITKLRNIKARIKKLARCKNPSSRQEMQAKITSDIESFIADIKSGCEANIFDGAAASKIFAEAENLKALFQNYKPGKVEEVLGIYKKILPKAEYSKIEKMYNSWVKSLDKSIKTETEDFMGKLRDLTMGSAPTDVLTILGAFSVLGYNLAKSDDNNQRVSIALKYGIPALAGIGSSLYFNAKLFAGSKALLASSLLSFGVNRLGSWADKKLKAYQQKKVQNPPKTV